MALTIEVINYKNNPPKNFLSASFGPEGGTLGRNRDNHLVLDDEFVSGKHALISCENGNFYLTDRSTNGTIIINKNLKLQGEKTQINSGDRLRIGEYELSVYIIENVSETEQKLQPITIKDILGINKKTEFVPHEPPKINGVTWRELIDTFMESAAIDDRELFKERDAVELMRTLGSVFRELIEGLMEILDARAKMKSVFRVSRTIIDKDENNPLKFAPTAEKALELLLKKKEPGFKDAANAVREGFEDVQHHQFAMIAGVESSLASVLKRLSPENFEKKCQGGISFQRKVKCWDVYNNSYRQIVEEAMDDLFGREFIRAYENKIVELRAKNHKR
jgi:predicted component of type VI protein secretion system